MTPSASEPAARARVSRRRHRRDRAVLRPALGQLRADARLRRDRRTRRRPHRVAGARLFRPSLRLPWYLFAAGLLAFSVGDVLFNLYAFVWHRDPPVPSVADVFYLAGYPFLAAGLSCSFAALRSDERRGGRIDAATFDRGVRALPVDLPHAGPCRLTAPFAERFVALSYPAMDVVLLAALVFFALTPDVADRFVSLPGRQPRPARVRRRDLRPLAGKVRPGARGWMRPGCSRTCSGAWPLCTPSMRELSAPAAQWRSARLDAPASRCSPRSRDGAGRPADPGRRPARTSMPFRSHSVPACCAGSCCSA